jgi:hypothetical protein
MRKKGEERKVQILRKGLLLEVEAHLSSHLQIVEALRGSRR